jgi:hypothetical protein
LTLEQRILERIAREFPAAERASVIELLSNYSGPENGRVTWDILALSNGSLHKVRRYVQVAQTDYRDILYWAEYHENDPMLRDRDPKKLVENILARFGGRGGSPNRPRRA